MSVKRLFCKRPIQCLASSKILPPLPPPPGECVLPPSLVRGEDIFGRRQTQLCTLHMKVLCGYVYGKGQMFPKPCHSVTPLVYKPALWGSWLIPSTRMKRIFCASFPLRFEAVFLNRLCSCLQKTISSLYCLCLTLIRVEMKWFQLTLSWSCIQYSKPDVFRNTAPLNPSPAPRKPLWHKELRKFHNRWRWYIYVIRPNYG